MSTEELMAEIERLKTRVKVTRWSAPGSPVLVLPGTIDESRSEAAQYFAEIDGASPMTGKESMMTNAELETLPEFEG